MKKLIVLMAALFAALVIVGCKTPPPAGPSAAELLASAKGNAPDGVLVGLATAKGSAEQTAMSQIKRGMIYIVGEMIDEQAAGGRLSASAANDLKTSVNSILSRASLANVVKVDSGLSAAGDGWAVYYLSKADTLSEITKAVNLAKESVAAGNFNLNNFDAKFAAAIAREWKN